MATLTANATASLSASGTSTATGSITWTAPALPAGVAAWDSIRISGTWSWTGRGGINRVTINGTNTTTGVAFDIALPLTVRSPLSITCVGSNKNATGRNFSWSGLTVTYTYTAPTSEQIMSKVDGAWTPATKVFKKIDGSWVEQTDLKSVFDANTKYVKG